MKNPQVLLQVQDMGEIVLELDHVAAPVTAARFLNLVDAGFYDGMVFHKISPQFTIAAGERSVSGARKQPHCITNESTNGLRNLKYTLAMGRKLPRDSVAGEFFINMVDNPRLDRRDDSHEGSGCPVFGRVIKGFEVVEKIANAQRLKNLFMEDHPAQPIVIEKAAELH